MKQLILHVGFHKTATSSFQATCAKNRALLVGQGVCYPSFSLGDRTFNNHTVPIVSLFTEDPSSYHANVRQRHDKDVEEVNEMYRKQLDHILEDDQNILFSGEGISMLSASALENLKTYIESRGFTLRILCSVRKPYAYLCSEYQQLVQGGTLDSFIGRRIPRKSKQVQVLKSVFSNIEFCNFETDCSFQGGPVAAMLDRIGIASEGLEYVSANEGAGNITTRLYAAINARYPILKKGKLNPRGRDRKTLNFDDTKFLLNQVEIDSAREGLDEENRAMENALGSAFTDKEYKASGALQIDKSLALEILKDASHPAHIVDSVADFLCQHSDGSWALADLIAPLLEQTEISPSTVDFLRDQAIANEGENLQLAHDLMLLALSRRPDGWTIRKNSKNTNDNLKSSEPVVIPLPPPLSASSLTRYMRLTGMLLIGCSVTLSSLVANH